MSIPTVQTVVAAAQQLSPNEQFEVLEALTRLLHQQYTTVPREGMAGDSITIMSPLPPLRRTAPVTNLADFAADFWPAHETADEVNRFIATQRAADRMHDLPPEDL